MDFNLLSDELVIDDSGPLAVIYLNRPEYLNALDMEMVRVMRAALSGWADNDRIKAVFISGLNEEAFCAGGDMKAVYWSGMAFRKEQASRRIPSVFFSEEYALNKLIHDYPKPVITFMNGISMGGAFGIAGPSRYRIACENTVFAMPEAAIGFFPDVGSSCYLNACPENIGTYLALSGCRINADDMLYAGLASHCLPLSEREEFVKSLRSSLNGKDPDDVISGVIEKFAISPTEEGHIKTRHVDIAECFSGEEVEEILERARGTSWGEEIISQFEARSPTSLKVIRKYLLDSAGLGFSEVLDNDFKLGQHFILGHDFYEGIRAVLIDKDNNPAWSPSRIENVSDELVESYFEETGFTLSEAAEL
jgi:enoyl-CoA hydratase